MTKVSVVMSYFNDENFVAAAINSVLSQTFSDFELIIVDDGSTDSSFKIAKQFDDKRIKILRNGENRGIVYSLNRGIKYSKGEYIARMDSDDISKKDRLKKQLDFFKRNNLVAICGTWAVLINEKGDFIKKTELPVTNEEIKRNLIKFNPFIHSTMMFRRSLIENGGFYRKDFEGAEDYELVVRISQKYKLANIPEYLHFHRLEFSGISFAHLKKVEMQSLKTRVIALKEYGYPFWNMIYLLKPLVLYLFPSQLKLFFLKNIIFKK